VSKFEAFGAAGGGHAELVGGRVNVPVVLGGEVPYVNLDYAASAPCLRRVADRVTEVLPWYASVSRGAGHLSFVATSLYESARATVHEFVGARDDDVVIFTRNTTDSLNLLASVVPDQAEVLFLDIEHHADLLPWQRGNGRAITAGSTIAETLVELERALERGSTTLVAVTGASNVTGEMVPLKTVAALAHKHGARISVDGAQLAPHRRIDMGDLDIDYLALSGHKCYAPFGAGVLVGRRDWLDAAPAYLAGGGAVKRVTIESTQWAPSPDRHEAGSPNLVGAVALAEATVSLAELMSDGLVADHDASLRDQLLDGIAGMERIHPLRIWDDSEDAVGIVAFEVEGYDAALVAAYLSCEHGIGVRAGKFCAHPLLNRINHGASAVRASFGLGTTAEDIDRLLLALRQLTTTGIRRTYVERDGWLSPDEDVRPTAFPK